MRPPAPVTQANGLGPRERKACSEKSFVPSAFMVLFRSSWHCGTFTGGVQWQITSTNRYDTITNPFIGLYATNRAHMNPANNETAISDSTLKHRVECDVQGIKVIL